MCAHPSSLMPGAGQKHINDRENRFLAAQWNHDTTASPLHLCIYACAMRVKFKKANLKAWVEVWVVLEMRFDLVLVVVLLMLVLLCLVCSHSAWAEWNPVPWGRSLRPEAWLFKNRKGLKCADTFSFNINIKVNKLKWHLAIVLLNAGTSFLLKLELPRQWYVLTTSLFSSAFG